MPEGADEPSWSGTSEIVGRRVWLVRIGISLLFGLHRRRAGVEPVEGLAAVQQRGRFGVKDPQFGQDVSLYVFRLPFLTFVVDWLFAAFVIILIITVVAHYLNGGIRLQVQHRRVSSQVKLHMSMLLAVLALLKAVGYWLDRYELTASTRGAVKGATYTDVNAQLPALKLLAIISLLAAVLLIINVWQRGWRLPVIAVGLWVLVAIVAGTGVPGVRPALPGATSRVAPGGAVHRAQHRVHPQGVQPGRRRQPALSRSDRSAPRAVTADQAAIEDSRLVDPEHRHADLPAPAGAGRLLRVQGPRRRPLHDRRPHAAGGAGRPRAQPGRRPVTTWEGKHLAYTHGYGVALAPASQVRGDGSPNYLTTVEGGSGPLLTEPEIYFGEGLDSYSVVATERAEISLNDQTSSYTGDGGVKMSSGLRRAAFALRFGEYNLLGSGLINKDSRILYIRDVRERVQTLAPFLDFDADPYPVITNGRMVWVLDGYTTSSRYPYSENADNDELSAEQRSAPHVQLRAQLGEGHGRRLRRHGDLLRGRSHRSGHQRVGEGVPRPVHAGDEVPIELEEHFRYPEDLFRVQTNMYGRYHVDDPNQFFQRDQFWSVAQEPPQTVEPGSGSGHDVQHGQRHHDDEHAVRPLQPVLHAPARARRRGTAVLARAAVRPLLGERRAQEPDRAHGGVERPGDVRATPRAQHRVGRASGRARVVDSEIKRKYAADFTLESQTGSKVRLGTLQAIPIGDSVLWVRPWYVQAQQTPIPQLNYVVVAFGDQIFRARTLEGALKLAFPESQRRLEHHRRATHSVGPVAGREDGEAPATDNGSEEPTEPSALRMSRRRSRSCWPRPTSSTPRRTPRSGGPADFATYQAKINEAFELVTRAEELSGGNGRDRGHVARTPRRTPPPARSSAVRAAQPAAPAGPVDQLRQRGQVLPEGDLVAGEIVGDADLVGSQLLDQRVLALSVSRWPTAARAPRGAAPAPRAGSPPACDRPRARCRSR